MPPLAAAGAAIAAAASTTAGTAAAVGTAVATAAAAIVSTVSSVQQARSSSAQDKELARAEIDKARAEEDVNRRQSAKVMARQEAQGAAAGLESSGSPLALMLDSAYNSELNALQIRKQGEYNSEFYKQRARMTRAKIPGMIFGGVMETGGGLLKAYATRSPAGLLPTTTTQPIP